MRGGDFSRSGGLADRRHARRSFVEWPAPDQPVPAGQFRLSREDSVALTRPTCGGRLAEPKRLKHGAQVGLDQTIALTIKASARRYPARLRRVRYRDPKTGKTLIFLTNNFDLPPATIADLYRCRWQIELFFKWIKQHLRIKRFFGTTENAVKTQIWIAVCVYVLVAIVKKRLALDASLYTILQLISVTAFEKMPMDQLLSQGERTAAPSTVDNQLNLFTY